MHDAMKTDFVQAGPVRLQYFEHGSGDQVIVFVHGYVSSGRAWKLVQEGLDGRRYRTIAISQRGAGESGRDGTEDDYTYQAFARNLHDAVAALGVRDYVLVGHSMGGATVSQFALDHPGLAKALVLLNPTPLLGRILPPDWEARIRTEFLARMWRDPISPDAPADYREAVYADVVRCPLERLIGGRRSMSREQLRLRERLQEINVPTIVIGGDRDYGVGVDNIVADYLALRPELRSLHIFHGIGHSPLSECPSELVGVLDRFVCGLG
jgi:pimeloyl-ACP methyl ester carboxylesterase